jgi:hypothetical protein
VGYLGGGYGYWGLTDCLIFCIHIHDYWTVLKRSEIFDLVGINFIFRNADDSYS